MGGANHRGLGDRSPQRVQGQSPGRGSGGRSPPEAEEFFKVVTSKFYAFFGSMSHIFTYICLCFSAFAGIIPLSLRNGGGHLIPFAPPTPLSASGGATARRLYSRSLLFIKCRLCVTERTSGLIKYHQQSLKVHNMASRSKFLPWPRQVGLEPLASAKAYREPALALAGST